jgi:hypothetical protein
MKRRDLMGAIGATALTIHAPQGFAAPPAQWEHDARRTYQSIARGRSQLLVDGVRDPHQFARALHREFPQIIEQNLASLDPVAMSEWVDNAEPALWPTLAACYETAIANAGRPHVLADLLALNLDIERLARLAPYLAPQTLETALMRWRPEQHAGFLQLTATSPHGVAASTMNSGPTIDYTLREVYLSYRTAPVGSLTVRAALYEATVFAGRHLVVAWGVGTLIGSGLAPLIQHYAPGLWNNIGASVHWFVSQFQSATTVTERGRAQRDLLQPMDVGEGGYRILTTTGGDYLVAKELPILITGGGLPCFVCHPHRGESR